ncbi:hypothetical protein [Bacillus mycoides]
MRRHEGLARQEKAQEAETRAISERRIMFGHPREDTKQRIGDAAP